MRCDISVSVTLQEWVSPDDLGATISKELGHRLQPSSVQFSPGDTFEQRDGTGFVLSVSSDPSSYTYQFTGSESIYGVDVTKATKP